LALSLEQSRKKQKHTFTFPVQTWTNGSDMKVMLETAGYDINGYDFNTLL